MTGKPSDSMLPGQRHTRLGSASGSGAGGIANPVFRPFLIHSSNKFQKWFCSRPNDVKIFCFSVKLWSQRSKLEAQPLGTQWRTSRRIHSHPVGTCSDPNSHVCLLFSPTASEQFSAAGQEKVPALSLNLLPNEVGLELRRGHLAQTHLRVSKFQGRVRQQPSFTFSKMQHPMGFYPRKERGTIGRLFLSSQLVQLMTGGDRKV